MKKYPRIIIFFFITLAVSWSSYAEDKHDDHGHEPITDAKNRVGKETGHSEGEASHSKKKKEHQEADHKEKEGHGHNESEGEEAKDHAHEEGGHAEEGEAENTGVGPDKGILEKGTLGFKLAPEAIKTFELEYRDIETSDIEVPRSTLVTIRDGKFLYGFKDDWIKRHPVTILSKTSENFRVRISNPESVGKIIVKGVGFVRGAELIVEEGSASGHSH